MKQRRNIYWLLIGTIIFASFPLMFTGHKIIDNKAKELAQQLNQTEREKGQLKKDLEQITAGMTALQADKDNLTRQLGEASTGMKALQANKGTLTEQLEKATKDTQALQAEKGTLTEQLGKATKDTQALQAEKGTLTEQLGKAMTDTQALQAKNKGLTEEKQILEAFVRQIMAQPEKLAEFKDSGLAIPYPVNWPQVSSSAGIYKKDLEQVVSISRGELLSLARFQLAYAKVPRDENTTFRFRDPSNIRNEKQIAQESGSWTVTQYQGTLKEGVYAEFLRGEVKRKTSGKEIEGWAIILETKDGYLEFYRPLFQRIMSNVVIVP